MKHLIILLLIIAGCSASAPQPLPVTRTETETLQDAGFSRLGGRTWRSETMWRNHIHTCQALYSADIVCSGSTEVGRRYAVVIMRWEGGTPIKVYGTGGAKLSSLYEAVGTVHHEIERYEAGEREAWQSRGFGFTDSLRQHPTHDMKQ